MTGDLEHPNFHFANWRRLLKEHFWTRRLSKYWRSWWSEGILILGIDQSVTGGARISFGSPLSSLFDHGELERLYKTQWQKRRKNTQNCPHGQDQNFNMTPEPSIAEEREKSSSVVELWLHWNGPGNPKNHFLVLVLKTLKPFPALDLSIWKPNRCKGRGTGPTQVGWIILAILISMPSR